MDIANMDTFYMYIGVAVAVFVVFLSVGIPLFLAEYFPYKNLTDQRKNRPTVVTKSYKGRTALVTGANGAFGSRAAKIFAQRDVDTLVLVDLMDCTGVKEDITAELEKEGKKVPKILVWRVDMMNYEDCRALAEKAANELEALDHVLMTAGILSFKRRESPEGWETSIQVNFVSSALLGLLFLPLLKSSPSNPNPPVLTFVTTFGIYPSSFTMGVPKAGSYLKKLSNNKGGELDQGHQYGRSKGLLLYFSRELAARASAAKMDVTINSADPGSAWTGLTNQNKAKLIPRLVMNLGARDPLIGATALVNGASAPGDAHGKIMMDFHTATYPPFMNRKSGLKAQEIVWRETKDHLEGRVPELKPIYEMLDAK